MSNLSTAVPTAPLPTAPLPTAFACYIGLDRSDRKLDLCLQDTPTAPPTYRVLSTDPTALHQWLGQLRQECAGQPVAICLEQPAAALLHLFLSYDFLTVYAINPVTLAKYRQAFTPSRAKADASDAYYLMELVRDHRDKLMPWQAADEKTRTLLALVQARRQAVDLRTQLSNTLKAHLKLYFPQALQLVGDELATALATDFLLKWPSLQQLKRAQVTTVRRFYHAHQVRSASAIETRLALIQSSLPLSDDSALLTPAVLTTQLLATQLRYLLPAITAYEAHMQQVLDSHPDAPIFASLPGAGLVHSARLLVAFGGQRARFESAEAVTRYTGIAPVIKQSGNSRLVQRRKACSRFVHQSLVEYAHQSLHYSEWAKAYYGHQRQQGKRHYAAVRAVAYKWIRIIFRCWQERENYDEARYQQVLERRGVKWWCEQQAALTAAN